jgi:hypothetical protein
VFATQSRRAHHESYLFIVHVVRVNRGLVPRLPSKPTSHIAARNNIILRTCGGRLCADRELEFASGHQLDPLSADRVRLRCRSYLPVGANVIVA